MLLGRGGHGPCGWGSVVLENMLAVCRDSPELVLAPDRGMPVSHVLSFCIAVLDAMYMNVRISVLLDKDDTEPNMILCGIYEKNLLGHFPVFLTKG
jgi:hypothetical protein